MESNARPHHNLWDKIWRDKRGHVVIFQMPNVPLYAWLAFSIATMVLPRGQAANVTWWLSEASLAIWASLEIFKGVNYFRRGLGLVVLILVTMTVFGVGR